MGVFSTCLTINCHPDRFLMTEPYMYITILYGLLLASMNVCIFPAGHFFSAFFVCLCSVKLYKYRVDCASALPLVFFDYFFEQSHAILHAVKVPLDLLHLLFSVGGRHRRYRMAFTGVSLTVPRMTLMASLSLLSSCSELDFDRDVRPTLQSMTLSYTL